MSSQKAGAFWKPGLGYFSTSESGVLNPKGEIPRLTTSFCLKTDNVGSSWPGWVSASDYYISVSLQCIMPYKIYKKNQILSWYHNVSAWAVYIRIWVFIFMLKSWMYKKVILNFLSTVCNSI